MQSEPLLLFASFHNIEMTQFRSVNFIYLVYKFEFLFWTCPTFWTIFMTDLQPLCLKLYFLVILGDGRNLFFDILYLCFLFIQKTEELVLKKIHNSGFVGHRKLPNPSISNVFNLWWTGLRYIIWFEWPDFGPKCLVTGQLPKFKASVWNFPISETGRKCNLTCW